MKQLMLKAAKEAGKIVSGFYGNFGKLRFKDPRNLVTKVDLLSEKKIMDMVRKKFPDHNFITEESGEIEKGSEYTWIIDPIDGTTNFVSEIPQFTVSIALAKNDEVIMGVVYNPCTKDIFFAEKGRGAFLNRKKILVSKKKSLKDCLLSFSMPGEPEIAKKTLFRVGKIYGNLRAVRNFGAATINSCYLAAGKFDLYFAFDIKPWDIAASKLIVEEAGGKVTNLEGKRWSLDDSTIVASNKILHNKFIRLLK
jgi:myo-inositol-1(or 4)-monophosphatase